MKVYILAVWVITLTLFLYSISIREKESVIENGIYLVLLVPILGRLMGWW